MFNKIKNLNWSFQFRREKDNTGILTTKIDADCKKKHVKISYNIMHECVASRVTNPVKIDTNYNLANFLTKGLGWESHNFHTRTFCGKWSPLDDLDMKQIKLWRICNKLDQNHSQIGILYVKVESSQSFLVAQYEAGSGAVNIQQYGSL